MVPVDVDGQISHICSQGFVIREQNWFSSRNSRENSSSLYGTTRLGQLYIKVWFLHGVVPTGDLDQHQEQLHKPPHRSPSQVFQSSSYHCQCHQSSYHNEVTHFTILSSYISPPQVFQSSSHHNFVVIFAPRFFFDVRDTEMLRSLLVKKILKKLNYINVVSRFCPDIAVKEVEMLSLDLRKLRCWKIKWYFNSF